MTQNRQNNNFVVLNNKINTRTLQLNIEHRFTFTDVPYIVKVHFGGFQQQIKYKLNIEAFWHHESSQLIVNQLLYENTNKVHLG